MKIIDGVKYLSIGEVSTAVGRGAVTIIRWVNWYSGLSEAEKANLPKLPQPIRVGSKQIRFFKESDIQSLIAFRDKMSYGVMADFNRNYWGKRSPAK